MSLILHPNGKIEGINNANFNSSMPAGHVIQVQYSHTTDTDNLATTGIWSSLDTNITPVSTSSSVLVMVTIGLVSSDSSADVGWDILRDSTALQTGSGGSVNSTTGAFMNEGNSWAVSSSLVLLDDEISTTSQVTYRVRAAANSPRTMQVNRRNSDTSLKTQSRMTLMEIAG